MIVTQITTITGNLPLAVAIHRSIAKALETSFVHLAGGKTAKDIFETSLNAAIRDIENHPLGKLFRRLIEFGPHNPDEPEAPTSDGETVLSDPECGTCVEFIFSHMINRFKGELAELLALTPTIELVMGLQAKGQFAHQIDIYWGDTIKQRRRKANMADDKNAHWQGYAKGADGLIVEFGGPIQPIGIKILRICGVVEVKSMARSKKKLREQIGKHLKRLAGGVRLQNEEWISDNIQTGYVGDNKADGFDGVSIVVVPSSWKLSREWRSVDKDGSRTLQFPEPSDPTTKDISEELEPLLWRIKLAWSQEALNQSAYEMTFWYMSRVGSKIYSKKELPKGWEGMTPEEAGLNAIKMMLYFAPLRYLSTRQQKLAIRLYNVYSFGYALGVDSKEMLWLEDFPHQKEENTIR